MRYLIVNDVAVLMGSAGCAGLDTCTLSSGFTHSRDPSPDDTESPSAKSPLEPAALDGRIAMCLMRKRETLFLKN
jgi:hypothetical protein